MLAAEVAARHARAYPDNAAELAYRSLEIGGEYQWRREGEPHLFNPETVFKLQHATRTQREVFREYTAQIDELSRQAGTLRRAADPQSGLSMMGTSAWARLLPKRSLRMPDLT